MTTQTSTIYNINPPTYSSEKGASFTLAGEDLSRASVNSFHYSRNMSLWDWILNFALGWLSSRFKTEEVFVNRAGERIEKVFLRASDIAKMDQRARVLERVHAVAAGVLNPQPVAIKGVDIKKIEGVKIRQRERVQELRSASPEKMEDLFESDDYWKELFPPLGGESGLSTADFMALQLDDAFVRSCRDGIFLHLSKRWGWASPDFQGHPEQGSCVFKGSLEDREQLKKMVAFMGPMGMAFPVWVKKFIDASLRQSDRIAWEKTYQSLYLEYLRNLKGRPPKNLADPDPIFDGGESYYWRTMFPSRPSGDFDPNLRSDGEFTDSYRESVCLHALKQWGWDVANDGFDLRYKPERIERTEEERAQLDRMLRSAVFMGQKELTFSMNDCLKEVLMPPDPRI